MIANPPHPAAQLRRDSVRGIRNPYWWQLLLLLAISVAYEFYLLRIGINVLDEGWPLYAAMRLQEGGTLYQDVFWVFPPGHVLPAWVAYWLDPPGLLLARGIYAGFTVALCVALHLLGRRLMPASFALLGALLLAVAAPRTHTFQLVFGYRYLLFSVLALLAFSCRLRTGDHRWMFVAGVCTGTALFFRLTPAFAVSCGLAVAVVAADPAWRSWLRSWSWFALGQLVVIAPVLVHFSGSVGVGELWREVVLHPLWMLQPLPLPQLHLPRAWNQIEINIFFFTLQFRIYPVLYGGYIIALVAMWIRSLLQRRQFEHALLLAVVIWGAVYFFRAFGRSDEPHVDSVIPPVCLLLAHLSSLVFRWFSTPSVGRRRTLAEAGACAVVLGAWVFLLGVNKVWHFEGGGAGGLYRHVTVKVDKIQELTQPGDTLLDLSASPLLHVLVDRTGAGYRDVIMPGTFLDEEEEQRFLERLRASPPELVIWPLEVFDGMSSRSLRRFAPRLVEWVVEHYEAVSRRPAVLFMLPRGSIPEGALRPRFRCRGKKCGERYQVPWEDPFMGRRLAGDR